MNSPDNKTSHAPLSRRARWLRRMLFIVAALLTLIALFYAEENWRGKRAWERHRQEVQARGGSLDRAAFIPPEVPDSENFFMTPFLAPFWDFVPGTQEWRDTNAVQRAQHFCEAYERAAGKVKTQDNSPPSNSWVSAQTDLRAWSAALRQVVNRAREMESGAALAPPTPQSPPATPTEMNLAATNVPTPEAAGDILTALKDCEGVIEELRAASRRPFARAKVDYNWPEPTTILLPHLATIRRTVNLLELRASAQLALGQTDQAFEDLRLAFKLIDSLRDEPIIISYLVRIACLTITLRPIAEGMKAQQWSEAQLQEFQNQLRRFDFCAEGKHALEAERAMLGIGTIAFGRRSSNRAQALGRLADPTGRNEQSGLGEILLGLVPTGWFYFEQRNYSRIFEDNLMPTIDVQKRRVYPVASRTAQENITRLVEGSGLVLAVKHRAFSRMLLPAVVKIVRRGAFGQVGADLASLACALERHRLLHGEYPKSLETLQPRFLEQLPQDVLTGAPYRYRRTPDGRFLIYSVGWNEKDEGGTVGLTQAGKIEPQEGDWVWQ